jgi:hypothetical protein
MSTKRFKSKIDRRLFLVLVLAIVIDFVVIGAVLLQPGDPLTATITIIASSLVVTLIVSIMIGTYYTVTRDLLVIRSGPFRFKVPLHQIESVRESRSSLSSPAMSLDRLLIRYGKRRRIMVSPDDKAGFLMAIGQALVQQ